MVIAAVRTGAGSAVGAARTFNQMVKHQVKRMRLSAGVCMYGVRWGHYQFARKSQLAGIKDAETGVWDLSHYIKLPP